MELILILGQTSSGKTKSSLELAQKLINQGKKVWVVNCDSRQVYQKLNLGTGKIEGEWQQYESGTSYMVDGIPHFLIDYIDPRIRYSLFQYLLDWCKLFELPRTLPDYVILVGGTVLWANAIYSEYQEFGNFQDKTDIDQEILELINASSLSELQNHYLELSLPQLNNSDWNNSRRLQNAIRKFYLNKPQSPELNNQNPILKFPVFEKKYIFALEVNLEILIQRIITRIMRISHSGLVEEVESLLYLGDRLLELGLEYRVTYLYLYGHYTEDEWSEALIREDMRYAKRQLTWLRKLDTIWINSNSLSNVVNEIYQTISTK